MKPIRLRDFVEDKDGWIYAVSAYDNTERAGCVLRYVPDENGERVSKSTGVHYKKYDFEPAFEFIKKHKPQYLDVVHRIPLADIRRVIKPDEEIGNVIARNKRVAKLAKVFNVPMGTFGCTGSLLCGLENEASDVDMVVYGRYWFEAQKNLIAAVKEGRVNGMTDEMWDKVYNKRVPEIDYATFVLHEERKWNRGEIDGTYFDLLFTRSYDEMTGIDMTKGPFLGKKTIEATVTDASLSFDSPAVYKVDHPEISKVLSFTHTYSGQALKGEVIEACGVVEDHGSEKWLVVGTTREAKGEYIISKTLLEQN